jgi:hypothetical protein
MLIPSPRRAVLSAALLLLAGIAHAGHDEDPDPGQSWLLDLTQTRVDEITLLSGTIRATDDYGATHDRDFRLRVTGTHEREDRKLVLHRFEPACFDLAPVAKLTLEDYCDQITVTYDDGDARIEFSSLDANRRYSFELRADRQSPQNWQSLAPEGIAAPSLSLRHDRDERGVTYEWALETHDAIHRQHGEVTSEQLRDLDLTELEASLVGLGEVLLTFNRYAFQFADLPRDSPAYAPTPYSAWAEETVDGGCIFNVCFGNFGAGAGNAANNNNACSPQSPNYNPAVCPHDLTYATWPVSQRVKIQKIDDDTIRSIHFTKNVGPGLFQIYPGGGVTDRFAFISLAAVGGSAPLVYPLAAYNSPYGNECFRYDYTFILGGLFTYGLDLGPGDSVTHGLEKMSCAASSGRPPGRYRLYVHVDPDGSLDTPGYNGNNIGNSGLLDWVRLRD